MPEVVVSDALPSWIDAYSWALLGGAAGLLAVVAAMRRRTRQQTPETGSESLAHQHRDVWLEGPGSDLANQHVAPETPQQAKTGIIPTALEPRSVSPATAPAESQAVSADGVSEVARDSESEGGGEGDPQDAVLVVVDPSGETHRVPLLWGVISIGSDTESGVCLGDPELEPVHVLVSRDQNGHRITTFEEASGVPVSRPLVPGELFRFGGSTLRIGTPDEGFLPIPKRGLPALIRKLAVGE